MGTDISSDVNFTGIEVTGINTVGVYTGIQWHTVLALTSVKSPVWYRVENQISKQWQHYQDVLLFSGRAYQNCYTRKAK